jgi:hypothetical protein
MTLMKYILDEHGNPKSEPDLITWAEWMGADRNRIIVRQDRIGASKVSTVFLGLDYNFDKEGPPVLWETMVFGGELDQTMERCSGNREQAEAMHQGMVERVEAVAMVQK